MKDGEWQGREGGVCKLHGKKGTAMLRMSPEGEAKSTLVPHAIIFYEATDYFSLSHVRFLWL